MYLDTKITQTIKTEEFLQIYKIKYGENYRVVKKFDKLKMGNNAFLIKQVQNECKACKKFQQRDDPYVVKYFQVNQSQKYYNIQMEWCNNRTLKQELEADALAKNRGQLCILLLLSMLYGLTACHQRNLIHRDIKPENILVTHDLLRKKYKIADFGVCTFSHKSKEFQGTNFYQSPQIFIIQNKNFKCSEDFKKECEYGYLPNCDIFSLGVICYHLYQGLHETYNCIMFPFIQNLQALCDSGKYSYKYLTNLYYQAVTDRDRNLHNWKNWQQQGNKQRMKIFRYLTQRMLEPYPLLRVKFVQLYQLIYQNKSVLFKDLQDDQVITHFDKYYEVQKKLSQNKVIYKKAFQGTVRGPIEKQKNVEKQKKVEKQESGKKQESEKKLMKTEDQNRAQKQKSGKKLMKSQDQKYAQKQKSFIKSKNSIRQINPVKQKTAQKQKSQLQQKSPQKSTTSTKNINLTQTIIQF